MTENRLFLLDAYALIFRAYYALIKMPRMRRDGFNTSAVFGFVNTLEELLRKERPTHIAVCFDPSGPTFRNEAYEGYKAERAATPEDIRLSVPIIKEIVKAYRIPLLEVDGYEADDVIGTMAKRGAAEGYTVYMMTPDKDFGQLVGPGIFQYKPSLRGQDFEIRGEKEVCERYGLSDTKQVIDYLALTGDKVDNIPGCPGVGDKTAEKLIAQFGGVEGLLAHTDELKGALRKKIEDNREQIEFSKFLATIRTDVPMDADPADLKVQDPDRDKLFAIFREMEFRTLADRVARRLDGTADVKAPSKNSAPSPGGDSLFSEEELSGETPSAPAVESVQRVESDWNAENCDYRLVDNATALTELSERLATCDRCGLVVFADGENDMTAVPTGAAVAWEKGKAAYIPASFAEGWAFVLDLMARGDILKVTPAAKRDMVVAHNARGDNEEALVSYFDVAIAHYLLQPEMRHTLTDMSATYLGHDMAVAPVSATKRGGKVAETDPQALFSYACECANVALRLYVPLEREVEAIGMTAMLRDMELPLARVLADMETAGVRIDTGALADAASIMEKRIAELTAEIHSLAGEEFNIGSPAKVGEILFDRLQLDPKAKKTRTGQYSTSEDILEKLVTKHPIVALILEFRQLRKLVSTYLNALPEAINPKTGKVHTVYNQTVTATGRISSSNPNLQNIPVRDDVGRFIRRAFIADEGNLFLSADYSQIELRLVADLAGDETMLGAFRDGLDIHAITAAKIFHKEVEEVTADERRKAKTANFGILYGISAFGLASRLSIPRKEAQELIDNYFATFPAIHRYMSDSVEHAREKGYVSTKMGRRRMLPDINSRNPTVRGYAERNAINAPVQGLAADVIKTAMVAISKEMREKGLKSKMIMQVHDELNFDVVPEELPVMQKMVERLMEGAYSGTVRLTASCGVASNWLDAH